MDWAGNTKKLREKMLISQTELGKILGVSYVTVNRYENKVYEPNFKVKRKLKELYIKYKIIREE